MGWFWSTATAPAPKPPPQTQQRLSPPPPPPSDFDNDPELAKFLALFQEEMKDPKPAASSTRAPPQPTQTQQSPPASTTSKSSSWFTWSSPSAAHMPQTTPNTNSRHNPSTDPAMPTSPTPADELALSLLPTTMSCRQAFDLAWGCQSPVGQFNAIYRYGEVRACSDLWDDFWFCMRTKGYGHDAKAAAIREHYQQKGEKKYGGGKPSSEDVWRSRDTKVEEGSAFNMQYETTDTSDAEHNLSEMERRRKIREQLGYIPTSPSKVGVR